MLELELAEGLGRLVLELVVVPALELVVVPEFVVVPALDSSVELSDSTL